MQNYTRSYLCYKEQVRVVRAIKNFATYVGYTVLFAVMIFVPAAAILIVFPN